MATMLGFDGTGGVRKTMAKKPMISKASDEKSEEEEIISYREHWERCYGKRSGSFEDTTIVPPMRYTFGPIPRSARAEEGLQLFSVKVCGLKEEEGVHWPVHVYGFIAIRDSMDPRRNFIFHRTRDNCLTITEEDPLLLLTGPSHAVVILDPVAFEVQLKAKGESESKDKVLVFDVLKTHHSVSHVGHPPPITTFQLCGKRGNLDFTFAVLLHSVEATISVQVIDGSWPEDVPGRISTCTASIPEMDISLLDSRGARMPINDAGVIELTRQVVSVEFLGELKVEVETIYGGKVITKSVVFEPNMSTISYERCEMLFCTLGITVGWSLFKESWSPDI